MSRASERRQSGGSDEGGGANWMDTYGDLVTLLLTFFVLLFAFSTVDAEKWKSLVGSFGGPSATVITPLTPEMVYEKPIQPLPRANLNNQADPMQPQTSEELGMYMNMLNELYEIMQRYITENNIDAGLVLIAEEYMIVMRFNDKVFFNSGTADILPEAVSVLDHVVELFSQVEDLYEKLSIEGHTDNVPINTSRYPSNWELSIDRALNVQRYINGTQSIDPNRLKIGGYGEYNPIADNNTVEGRALNRRVDFIVEGKKP